MAQARDLNRVLRPRTAQEAVQLGGHGGCRQAGATTRGGRRGGVQIRRSMRLPSVALAAAARGKGGRAAHGCARMCLGRPTAWGERLAGWPGCAPVWCASSPASRKCTMPSRSLRGSSEGRQSREALWCWRSSSPEGKRAMPPRSLQAWGLGAEAVWAAAEPAATRQEDVRHAGALAAWVVSARCSATRGPGVRAAGTGQTMGSAGGRAAPSGAHLMRAQTSPASIMRSTAASASAAPARPACCAMSLRLRGRCGAGLGGVLGARACALQSARLAWCSDVCPRCRCKHARSHHRRLPASRPATRKPT